MSHEYHGAFRRLASWDWQDREEVKARTLISPVSLTYGGFASQRWREKMSVPIEKQEKEDRRGQSDLPSVCREGQ